MTAASFADMEQSNFEDAVRSALAKRIGYDPDIIDDNENFGVVPFIRLDNSECRRVGDWQELAAELARETGVGVTCIANCDWNMMKGPNEEATFITFAVPGVSENYRDDPYRNLIVAVDAASAPSAEDFEKLKRARRIVAGHLLELAGRLETLIAAGKNERDVLGRIEEIEKLKELTAGGREAVNAVLALDFDAAVAAQSAEAAPATPRM